MKELNSSSNHIRFTFKVHKEQNINFLHVKINLLNGHLMTNGQMCIKPMCIKSSHPNHIKCSIIYSQLLQAED